MYERILIILLLAVVGSGAFSAFRAFHMRRLGHVESFNQPLLLYFRSDHCAPCVTQSRYLDQLVQKWNGRIIIQQIDTDAEPDKARQFGILTLPTTILIDSVGQVRQVNYGLTNVQKLSQQLNAL